MIPKIFKLIAFSLLLIISSCGNSESDNKVKATEGESSKMRKEGNVIDQTNPALMVFPSDALMKRIGCINEIENQGTVSYNCDYKKAFIDDAELKFIIGSVEECFAKSGYPLESLEQQLKQINNDKAMDEMEGVAKDTRTLLMNTAKPDFILEIDYENKQDPNSRNPKKILNYTLTAIDVYANKVIASITRADISNGDESSTASSLIKSDLVNNIKDFQKQINQRFEDELANGVEITLRLTTDGNAKFNFGDECLGNENYNDWVNTWLKKNTVNSTFKPIKNTDKELRFTSVRIKPKTNNGQRYSAFDFANDLKTDFSKACGVKIINKTQGIGDAYIVVSGLK